MTRYGRRRQMARLCLVVLFVTATSCGRSASDSLLESMRARGQNAGSVRPYRALSELLGNVSYQGEGQAAGAPITEAVVVGEVVGVERGRAFRAESDMAQGGLDFDTRDAVWRTAHVRVRIRETISGAVTEPVVRVGFAAGPDFDLVQEGFEGLGPLLLFLNRSPVFAYDPEVYGTIGDGKLLGLVSKDGTIKLPVLEDSEESELTAGTETLSQLKAAADRRPWVIRVDRSGARVSP